MSVADAEAYRVGRVFEEDFAEEEPETVNVSGRWGDFVLVGGGEITNPSSCGKFRFFGCLRTELHGRMRIDGKDYRNKAYVKIVPYSCDKPSCPMCYKYGWASRKAQKIETRLKEAGKRWGQVEHIIMAIPPETYALPLDEMRSKALGALFSRSVMGGVLIFHGFRFNKHHFWYWSPHFHVLGFIRGGFGKCRGCEKCVKGCGGFVDRSYRLHEKDDCIVKVKGERITVGGTAWYQLHHATVLEGATRFHVATWFGVCSYRKLRVTVERKKHLCPLCQHELVPLLCFCDDIILDADSTDFKKEFYDLVVDGAGRKCWVEDVREGKS
jgi:hypothetical protein